MDTGDKENWTMATDDKHNNIKHTLKVTPRDELPDDRAILPHTRAMEKKASGQHKSRLNSCGHMQMYGHNYDSNNTAVPVVNEVALRVELTLMLILRALGKCFDVKGALLHGQFTNEKLMFIVVN